ncbi:MAG: DUF4097 domain-containing protein [Methanomicrobiales archaeon]|nr:DUF4097 domain-containing protein [Methanomicrobiales archaeon]
MRTVSFLVITAILLCTLSAGCLQHPAGLETTEQIENQYPVFEYSHVEVQNMNGKTTVTGDSGSSVLLHAVKRTRFGAAELERVRIDGSVRDGTLVLQTVGTDLPFSGVSVDVDVQVPASVLVGSVSSSNGEVSIRDVTGDVDAGSANGAITLVNIAGYVRVTGSNGAIDVRNVTGIRGITTSNGAVVAELRNIRSDIAISTANGEIRLAVATDLNATLIATTANGAVTAEGIPMNTTIRERTRIEGVLGDGSYRVTVSTQNGNIAILPL